MKNLTDKQILSTLRLNKVFPETVWFTEAKGLDTITIHLKEDATEKEGFTAIRSIFPSSKLAKYSTSDFGFHIFSDGECIGDLHLKQKEDPAPTESIKENLLINDTTWDDVLKDVVPWSYGNILRQEA